MQTPATIQNMIAQLGGNQIFAMAFAGSMYDGANKLTLKIARPLVKHAKGKATHVIVELDGDLYTVTTVRVGGKREHYAVTELEAQTMVYGDQLRGSVVAMTGLDLTLGTMGARSC